MLSIFVLLCLNSFRVSVMLESILSSHITSIIKSGVGIRMIANATLPIDGTLTIGQQGFKLHWNLTNPKQELLGLRSHPYAFLIRNERKPVGVRCSGGYFTWCWIWGELVLHCYKLLRFHCMALKQKTGILSGKELDKPSSNLSLCRSTLIWTTLIWKFNIVRFFLRNV